MAEATTVKVAFTANAVDEQTQIQYWKTPPGAHEELDPDTAARMVGADVAVVVEKEELEQLNSEQLDEAAQALGVDVPPGAKKVEKAKKIAGEDK